MKFDFRMTTCIFLYLTLSVGAQSQDRITLKETKISAIVDNFVLETLKVYDTLKVKDRITGVVTLEMYSRGKGFFRLGNFPNNDSLSYDPSDLTSRFRLSMVFDQNFFYGINPTSYSIRNDRPIVFQSGIETLGYFDLKKYDSFKKEIKKFLPFHDSGPIVTWLVSVNELTNEIMIEKKSYW